MALDPVRDRPRPVFRFEIRFKPLGFGNTHHRRANGDLFVYRAIPRWLNPVQKPVCKHRQRRGLIVYLFNQVASPLRNSCNFTSVACTVGRSTVSLPQRKSIFRLFRFQLSIGETGQMK